MNTTSLFKQTYLILFLTAIITSCVGQDNERVEKNEILESKKLPKIVKALGRGGVVSCSMEDRSGHLWFGTHNEGVFRFDGESFTNYTTKDGLNSNGVNCILQVKSGDILLGTGDGICRFDGKSFNDMTQNTPLSTSSISSIFEDRKGRIWVADYKDGYFNEGDYRGGVYLYEGPSRKGDGEVFTILSSVDGVENDEGFGLFLINEILEDADGNIWFGGQNDDGLNYYDGKRLVQYETRTESGLYNNVYRSMVFDNNGNLWLGTQPNGVLTTVLSSDGKGGKLPPVGKGRYIDATKNAGPTNSTIMALIYDKNGDLWIGTDGEGAWRYDGTSFTNYTTDDGLINNSVFSILEDSEGNLWFGTRNVGLCRYDGKSFTAFSE